MSLTRRPSISAFLFVSLIAFLPAGRAEDENPTEKISGWQKLFRKHAAEYVIRADSADSASLQLVREPILNWSQPVRGGGDGAVFLWTQEGRPLVIGTLFIWPRDDGVHQGIAHELHSLSSAPLTGAWRNRSWAPPKSSIVWSAMSDVAPPAATPEQRLRQMRDAARSFSAESHDKKERKWDLRLLPRPIYRYDMSETKAPAGEREVLDGALFGFVEGTDLEVVLLIQARKTDAGPAWEYALARMSDFRLNVRRNDKPVWDVPPSVDSENPRNAYYCTTVESRVTADDE